MREQLFEMRSLWWQEVGRDNQKEVLSPANDLQNRASLSQIEPNLAHWVNTVLKMRIAVQILPRNPELCKMLSDVSPSCGLDVDMVLPMAANPGCH